MAAESIWNSLLAFLVHAPTLTGILLNPRDQDISFVPGRDKKQVLKQFDSPTLNDYCYNPKFEYKMATMQL